MLMQPNGKQVRNIQTSKYLGHRLSILSYQS